VLDNKVLFRGVSGNLDLIYWGANISNFSSPYAAFIHTIKKLLVLRDFSITWVIGWIIHLTFCKSQFRLCKKKFLS